MGDFLSKTEYADYGLPQGGNIPPILYILYTNDIQEANLKGDLYIYADDICVTYSSNSQDQLEKIINTDMRLLQTWCERNVLTINESKSNYMIFNSKRTQQTINININGISLKRLTETNYLGLKYHR